MKRTAALAFVLLPAVFAWAGTAETRKTTVVVRVAANDGKLLDDNVGGARVRISDARSGKLLAEGLQQGNSGDTQKIMTQPHVRGAALFDTPGAAAFRTELALERPTLVRISATGPLKYPGSARTAEKLLLVVPGSDAAGDGIVLQVDGLIVAIEETHVAAGKMDLRAHVAMMCGCPITPGGVWDAGTFTIVAEVWRGKEKVKSQAMNYGGIASTFHVSFDGLTRGKYTVRVVAASANGVNAGQDARGLHVD
ncbi:MAG: hypothetical protein HYX28_07130 [Candidatus Koribacter versatilis]|uniref:Uncharacterized protein n=1 Tax=Candidatus Korobacter versatilis TaxID=658062 RepID=A0A932EQ86_9BACT|nr:hypothetical protein [Candidatus Koribacter versatilis]